MTTWRPGDSDPTLGARTFGGRTCFAVTHPQHIAGGTHDVIIEVWPVTA